MLVNWKKTSLKVVDLIPVDENGKSLAAEVTRLTVILAPGVNEVTDKEYALMMPHIKDSLDAGTLEPVRVGGVRVRSLRDVPVRQAIEIVKEAISPLTLSLWLETDPRDAIHAAILKRMDVLNIQSVPVDTALVQAMAQQNEQPAKATKAAVVADEADDEEEASDDDEEDEDTDDDEAEEEEEKPPVRPTKKAATPVKKGRR